MSFPLLAAFLGGVLWPLGSPFAGGFGDDNGPTGGDGWHAVEQIRERLAPVVREQEQVVNSHHASPLFEVSDLAIGFLLVSR